MVARERPCQRTLDGKALAVSGPIASKEEIRAPEGPGRQSDPDFGLIQWATIALAIVAVGWLGALVAILI